MTTKTTNSSRGISFTGVLAIVFIVLKLTNVIQWSWWWVLSPLWISAAISIALIVLFLIMGFVGFVAGSTGSRSRKY